MEATSATFPIRPSLAGGAGGSVAVNEFGGVAHFRIVITNLAPGSVHTIHDHLGFCGSAGRTTHLAVLAVATANAAGMITAAATLPAVDAGSAHIVIVYATATASVISGCAEL